jgi:tripartite-type tricarboxylate transporter receptor subunit TctC
VSTCLNCIRAVVLSLLLALTGTAMAQSAPTARIVVGFPPGQSVDVIGRLLAEQLGPALGQTFIVENMPGQGGSIALAAVARMPADGSALALAAAAALAGNPFLYSNVRYDSLKDFTPIGLVYDAPLVLLVNASSSARTVRDVVALAKASPGKLTFSSPGNGTVSHLAMTEFARRAGLDMIHVPYQGSAKSLTDLAGGIVQLSFDTIVAAQPYINSGKLHAIAVSSAERVALLPDLPTVAEAGFEGFDMVPWVAMVAPAGLPSANVERLNAEVMKIVRSDAFASRMNALGARPRPGTAAAFDAFLKREVARWGEAVKRSGAKLD